MESFHEAWDLICDYCKAHITDVAYKTWISRIEPVKLDFDAGDAILMVPNEFHRQTLNRCYMPLLNSAVHEIFGSGINNFGVQEILQSLIDWAPPPQARVQRAPLRGRGWPPLKPLATAWKSPRPISTRLSALSCAAACSAAIWRSTCAAPITRQCFA